LSDSCDSQAFSLFVSFVYFVDPSSGSVKARAFR
jgi:hypothetical protein